MRKNDILKCDDSIFRVLDIKNNEIFLIDCGKRTIPTWISENEIQDCTYLTEKELKEYIPIPLPDFDTMDTKSLCIINERYTLISGILPFVSDFRMRNKRIAAISAEYGICRQTIINYLCLYLAFQDKAVLAPKPCISDTTSSYDEKNFRWALNKFYVKNHTEITVSIMKWLYEHSAGVVSVVVSLIHDAQEIAILTGKEVLNLETLNMAYEQRMSMLHGYIQPSIKKGKSTSNIKSNETVIPGEVKETENKISISLLVEKSKSEGTDIVKLLKKHMSIEEVRI